MPITLTKKAAKTVQRRLRRACDEVRSEWSGRERRSRRIEAFQMQGRLAALLGVEPQKQPIAVPR